MSQSVLEEATRVVKDRAHYGPPHQHFADVAAMWSVIVGSEVLLWKVPMMMIALKMCREMSEQNRDNPVDIAGYAHLMGVLQVPAPVAAGTDPDGN